MLTTRASGARVLLDAVGVNRVVAVFVKEVAATSEISELAAMEDVTDEAAIGAGVKTMLSAGTEGISVWLRNRATFCCLEFRQRKTSSTATRQSNLQHSSPSTSKRSSRSKIRTYCQQYHYSETHIENPKNVREVEQKSVQPRNINECSLLYSMIVAIADARKQQNAKQAEK